MSDPTSTSMATPTGYLMVLRQGNDVLAALEALAVRTGIGGATFSGFGFAGRATFGFFDVERGDYVPQEFADLEMVALQSSLAWQDGKPSVHMHGVGAGADHRAVGGHVLALIVGRGSMELTITVAGKPLMRAHDAAIGANVLQLS